MVNEDVIVIDLSINKVYQNYYYHELFGGGNLIYIDPHTNETLYILDLDRFGVHYDAFVTDVDGEEKRIIIPMDTIVHGLVKASNEESVFDENFDY